MCPVAPPYIGVVDLAIHAIDDNEVAVIDLIREADGSQTANDGSCCCLTVKDGEAGTRPVDLRLAHRPVHCGDDVVLPPHTPELGLNVRINLPNPCLQFRGKAQIAEVLQPPHMRRLHERLCGRHGADREDALVDMLED